VNLGEGLEEIGHGAFCECTSLREILIPPAVKANESQAFLRCSQLMIANHGERLKEIGFQKFYGCA
jgi:hypothetical protein